MNIPLSSVSTAVLNICYIIFLLFNSKNMKRLVMVYLIMHCLYVLKFPNVLF